MKKVGKQLTKQEQVCAARNVWTDGLFFLDTEQEKIDEVRRMFVDLLDANTESVVEDLILLAFEAFEAGRLELKARKVKLS